VQKQEKDQDVDDRIVFWQMLRREDLMEIARNRSEWKKNMEEANNHLGM
jgi:hypothetical protein